MSLSRAFWLGVCYASLLCLPSYYVAFKNEETGKYLPAISTKKTTEATAIKQAWVWYREGIPHKGGALDIKTFSLWDSVHRTVISPPIDGNTAVITPELALLLVVVAPATVKKLAAAPWRV